MKRCFYCKEPLSDDDGKMEEAKEYAHIKCWMESEPRRTVGY